MLLKAWRQRYFDAEKTTFMFLAGAALPSYVRLLQASYLGSVQALPPDWPMYAGLAAVVALGLALQQLIKGFRGAWARPSLARTDADDDAADASRRSANG